MPSAAPFREESEEHVVRRLEAFSDIVIGFSLAQMTLNLALPRDVFDLFTKDSIALLAFGMTFVVVASMWWLHHRLFTHYFVPTTLNIVLNFLSLAGVMFLCYTLQVWIHSALHHDIAYAMYAWSISWITGIIALLTATGVALRGDRMDPRLASIGRRRSIRLGVIALAFAALGASSIALPSANALRLVMFGLVGLLLVWRLVERFALKAPA